MKRAKKIVLIASIFAPSISRGMDQALQQAKQREECSEKLLNAAQDGDLEMVKILAPFANINRKEKIHGLSPLRQAAQNGHADIVAFLLQAKASPDIVDNNGLTPFFVACILNKASVVKLFLEAAADPNVKPNGSTALMNACEQGYDDIAALLLNAKADASFVDINGNSTVLFASQNGHEKVLQFLLAAAREQELDIPTLINTKNPQGLSPLAQSIHKGHPDIAVTLIKEKADVSIMDTNGSVKEKLYTLAHLACHYNQPTVVTALLEHKADASLEDAYGRTADAYAKSDEMRDVFAQAMHKQHEEVVGAALQTPEHGIEDSADQELENPAGPEEGEQENGAEKNNDEEKKD